MTPPERLEALARVLREVETSDRTRAVIELLSMAMMDIIRTSPNDQAAKVEAIAKAMRD